MRYFIFSIIVFGYLHLFPSLNFAQRIASSNRVASEFLHVTRPGALFLLIPPDARTAGMGSTGIANNPDLTTVFYNTSKLPYTPNNVGIHASYTPWFTAINANQMYLMSIGGYYKFSQMKNRLTLSSSVRYFNYGTTTEVFNNDFSQLYQVRPFEVSADLGAGILITKGFSIGLAGRFVHSDLIGTKQNGFKPANTALGDLSFFYEKNLNYKKNDENSPAVNYYDVGYDKIFATLVLSNLGGKFNYQEALVFPELPPSSFAVGIGYRKILNDQNMITVSTEFNKLLVPTIPSTLDDLRTYYKKGVISNWLSSFKDGVAGMAWKTGAEYWYNDIIAGRVGGIYEFQKNGIAAITFGASLKYQYASFDVAYFLPFTTRTSIYNPLANTIRFGLSLYFQ